MFSFKLIEILLVMEGPFGAQNQFRDEGRHARPYFSRMNESIRKIRRASIVPVAGLTPLGTHNQFRDPETGVL